MDRLIITDVSPRDGLQNQPMAVSAQDKLRLIDCLVSAGVRSVEATSFVSPKAVPQMADASEVLSAVLLRQPELRSSVLVPNLKGLERAHAAGAREIAVVLAATETMNQKNINMSLQQAAEVSEQTVLAARGHGMKTRAYIAVAFDCPFEGATALERVMELSQRMLDAGADELVIADTIGSASPGMVRDRVRALLEQVPSDKLALHFHDTRGMGVANAWAAVEQGVRRFDASTGGIGGCPFAPGAAGNVASEDVVYMLGRAGIATGMDLGKLVESSQWLGQIMNRKLPGMVAQAPLFPKVG
jgi:hydroxymethylglutaryl-CoA lyase